MDDDSGAGLTPDDRRGWRDERDETPRFRGDGGILITSSWWCACLSALFLIMVPMIPLQDYAGNVEPSGVQSRFYSMLLSGIFMWLWAVLFAVGHVVRAIYFLPGQSMKVCADTAEVRAKIKARNAAVAAHRRDNAANRAETEPMK